MSLTLWLKIPLAQVFHYMRRSNLTWFPTYTPGFNERLDTNSPIVEVGNSKLETIIFRVRLFVFGSFFVSLLRIFAKSSCQFSTSQVLSEACSDVSVSPPFGPENFGVSKKSNSFPQNIPHTKHPKKKTHTRLRGVRNEVKLTGPSAQAPLRTDPFQTSVSRSATTCGSFCRNHKNL